MEFKYTEDQIALRRAVREWAQSYLAPKAEEIDVNNRFPTETIEALGEQDLMGLAYPEELGGAGYDAISEAIAMEEISAACAATGSIITGHYLGFDALYLAGTPEQKEKWLRPALEGEKYAAFCLTEPAGGSDMTSNKTTAVEDGDDYVINGVKHFITGGAHCDFLCCFAITNKEDPRHGMTCFVVEKGNPGMKIASEDNKMGIRGARTAEIVFEDCRVPKANMVGELNKGYRLALDVVDRGRIGIAAMSVGIAQAALDLAIKYAKEREVFKRPIAKFQGIQWMLADAATQVEAARMLTYYAADLKDQGVPFTKQAAMAKVFAAEAAHKVVDTSLQIHGGYGYMKEYPIERIYRDQRITELFEGTSQVQRIVIAGQLLH
ncbi:acyl-CoA dehydrogenase family protein [Colidextribacter sp. 210702-DFI.3.9]|nr:acyl-CoA dehydrogenase family protein [Colidextribacter sp. 210702-DFI.3.9]